MANTAEHYLFLNYSKAVKDFIMKSLYIPNYPPERNVAAYYLTPSRAFAKFIVPVINGSNLNPTITFHLSNTNPAPNQTPTGFFKQYKPAKDNTKIWEAVSHPLPWELTYRVTMWTAKQSEMDLLVYQAITSAPFNKKYSVIIDGQWAELEVRNPSNETSLEPGESQEVSIRYGFDVQISRAYLPLNYEEYYGTIEQVDVFQDLVSKI